MSRAAEGRSAGKPVDLSGLHGGHARVVSGEKPRVLLFAGSTRERSYNRRLAREAQSALERHDLEVTLADLRDYPMPF